MLDEILDDPRQAPLWEDEPETQRRQVSQLIQQARQQPEDCLLATLAYIERLPEDIRRGGLIRLFGLTGGEAPEALLRVVGDSSRAEDIKAMLVELGEWLEEGATVPDFGEIEQSKDGAEWLESFQRAVRRRKRLRAAGEASS